MSERHCCDVICSCEPLPCPFCGKIPIVRYRDYGHGVTEAYIYHDAQICPVSIKTKILKTKEGAIKSWNRRA